MAAAFCAGVSASQPWTEKMTAVHPIILLRVKILQQVIDQLYDARMRGGGRVVLRCEGEDLRRPLEGWTIVCLGGPESPSPCRPPYMGRLLGTFSIAVFIAYGAQSQDAPLPRSSRRMSLLWAMITGR